MTLRGAIVSVIAGVVLATIFVVDQFLGHETGKSVFPFLHYKYTEFSKILYPVKCKVICIMIIVGTSIFIIISSPRM